MGIYIKNRLRNGILHIKFLHYRYVQEKLYYVLLFLIFILFVQNIYILDNVIVVRRLMWNLSGGICIIFSSFDFRLFILRGTIVIAVTNWIVISSEYIEYPSPVGSWVHYMGCFLAI